MTTALIPSTDPAAVAARTCDVCGHPDSAHDVIALRYCKATLANALSRGCICAPIAT